MNGTLIILLVMPKNEMKILKNKKYKKIRWKKKNKELIKGFT